MKLQKKLLCCISINILAEMPQLNVNCIIEYISYSLNLLRSSTFVSLFINDKFRWYNIYYLDNNLPLKNAISVWVNNTKKERNYEGEFANFFYNYPEKKSHATLSKYFKMFG